MKKSLAFSVALIYIMLSISVASADGLRPTPAEESQWQITTSSQEVVDYSKYIAENSDGRIRYETIGYTPYGRPISMMVVSYPTAPKDETQVGDRLVIYVQSSIHSGEVEGKEAVLIFAREVAEGRHDELLKNVVVLINPNANPDGADTLGEWRVSSQPMPRLVGTRYNSQGYNLNRDYTKIEAPETEAAMRVLLKWDAAIFIDAHATDGLRHRHPVVFDCGKNANNDPRIQEANRLFGVSMFDANSSFRTMMKDSTDRAISEGRVVPNEDYSYIPPYSEGYATSTYDGVAGYRRIVNSEGKSEDIPTTWEGGGGQPRLSKTVLTVKNRFGILLECHSHNDYEYRVNTQYAAIYSSIEQAGKQKNAIKELFNTVDSENANRTSTEGVIVAVQETRVNADWIEPGETQPGVLHVSGYRFTPNADGDRLRGGAAGNSPADFSAPTSWELRNYTRFIPTPGTETRMGALYIFEPAAYEGVKLLQRHGIEVKRVTVDDVVLNDYLQFCDPSNTSRRGAWSNVIPQSSIYEGHYPIQTAAISADWFPGTSKPVPKGYYVVSTAQPFGRFAAFMLEPKAEDGLCYWNYYDTPLFSGERASGSFDIRKTYSFSAIPESALEVVKFTPDLQPTPEADVLDAVPAIIAAGLSSDVVLGQEAGYVTLQEEAAEMRGVPSTVNINGRYYAADYIASVESLVSPKEVEATTALPAVRFAVTTADSTGVVTLTGIDGANFLADYAHDIFAVAPTTTDAFDYLRQVYSPADLTDGTFIVSTTGVGHILQSDDPITAGAKFDVTIAVKDGGTFDLFQQDGKVGAEAIFVKAHEPAREPAKVSGGGCSALAIQLFALTLVPAVLALRKRTK
ncbi:MAG: hypothetical protein LBQ58_06420 [Synergistaceae bacterium]|jgi:hypothetical protein|nr:hypothetical protein [Synergistaceae bacterium]